MIALSNDFHFWGLEPEASYDDNHDEPLDTFEYPRTDKLEEVWQDDSVSKQLALVECLQDWDPWAQPTSTLIEKFQLISDASGPLAQGAAVFKARQFAMYQLTRESHAYDEFAISRIGPLPCKAYWVIVASFWNMCCMLNSMTWHDMCCVINAMTWHDMWSMINSMTLHYMCCMINSMTWHDMLSYMTCCHT